MSNFLFILAPHRSFTSVTCMMLGQHPQMYGLPEMNLFVADTMEEWWSIYHRGRALGANGLLRVVAQLYFGGQSASTIELARRWIWRRLHWTTSTMFEELAEKVYPLILVDKSPTTACCRRCLQRLGIAFPKARFLHLLRHPREYSESMIVALDEFGIVPGVADPQSWWYATHNNILTFLEPFPGEQKMQLRGEDLLTDLDRHLLMIVNWLGLRCDSAAIEQMKHPENTPYSRLGPSNAPLGNDLHFLQHPTLRSRSAGSDLLEKPRSQRWDRTELLPDVRLLARKFGYE